MIDNKMCSGCLGRVHSGAASLTASANRMKWVTPGINTMTLEVASCKLVCGCRIGESYKCTILHLYNIEFFSLKQQIGKVTTLQIADNLKGKVTQTLKLNWNGKVNWNSDTTL